MDPKAIRTLIEQARSGWMAGKADEIAQLFASDGAFVVPGQRWQGQANIRKEIARFAEAHTDVLIEIKQILIEGDRAAVEWYYEDTEVATGQRNRSDDVILVDFKQGQIYRWREFFDTKTPMSH